MQQQKVSEELQAHERNLSNALMMAFVTLFFLGLLIFFCVLIKDNAVWLVVAVVFTVLFGIAFLWACYKVWGARKLKLAAAQAQRLANEGVVNMGLSGSRPYTGMA